jgi:hypothetical protein
MAPIRLFAHVAPTRTVEPPALDQEHAPSVELGEVGAIPAAGLMSDRHERELRPVGSPPSSACSIAWEPLRCWPSRSTRPSDTTTEHALIVPRLPALGALAGRPHPGSCRRAREISKSRGCALERAYRRAAARIGGQ